MGMRSLSKQSWFQSLLLQVSFKTAIRSADGRVVAFQSLLLQVSFKTPRRQPAWAAGMSFQSLLLQVSFKTMVRGRNNRPPGFQSLLLQVSFKTQRHLHRQSIPRFNPFSFRSPSKRGDHWSPRTADVSIPSPSGLLQNGRSRLTIHGPISFNPFSFRSPSKRGKR